MTDKPIVLILVGSYLPGFRGGGPIRSIANLVDSLGDEFAFKIITHDHDHGVQEPYAGITSDTWCLVGKAEVYYSSDVSLRLPAMARLLNSIDFDVLYLNSFFSFQFSIKPLLLRRLKLIPEVFTIVAPRGEFSPGALVLKWFKKRIFITFARSIGLYRYIHWQASSDLEAMDISNVFFNDNKIAVDSLISVASDVGSNHYVKSQLIKPLKRPGMLEIAFLSRISPKKNLDGALSMLIGLNGNITFNIFGPVEDQCYWQRCQSICDVLNTNIKVNFHGAVGHNSVKDAFCANHLFLFPTHGENFGHVILEAFLEGCPVLLSDQTPWRNLESLRVGWDLPLDSPDEFRSVLKRCVDMDNEEFTNISRSAMDYGKRFMNDSSNLECNKRLFTSLSNGNLPKQK